MLIKVVFYGVAAILIGSMLTCFAVGVGNYNVTKSQCARICNSADVVIKDGHCGCITWHTEIEKP